LKNFRKFFAFLLNKIKSFAWKLNILKRIKLFDNLPGYGELSDNLIFEELFGILLNFLK